MRRIQINTECSKDQANNDRFILLCILLFSLLIRLHYATDWLRVDELMHFSYAKSPFGRDFLYQLKQQAHPPLTYILMKPFLLFGSSAYLVRMVSLLSGLVNIFLINVILHKICKSTWCVYLGTLYIGNLPVFILQSVDARQYSLCLVFVWLSLYLYLKMIENKFSDIKDHVVFSFAILLALVSDYSAVFYSSAIVITAILHAFFSENNSIKYKIKFFIPYIIVAIITGSLFHWQFGNNIPHYGHIINAVFPNEQYTFSNIFIFFVHQIILYANCILPNPLGILVIAMPLLGIVYNYENLYTKFLYRNLSYAYIFSIFLLFIASLLKYFPFSYARHISTTVPILSLIAIGIVENLILSKVNSRRLYVVVISIVLLTFTYKGIRGFSGLAGVGYQKNYNSLKLYEYKDKSIPVVGNFIGRIFYGWWMNQSNFQLVNCLDNTLTYNYSDAEFKEITRWGNPAKQIKRIWALTYKLAKKNNKCWIVLSFRQKDQLKIVEKQIMNYAKALDDINCDFIRIARPAKYEMYTLVAKITNDKGNSHNQSIHLTRTHSQILL